MPATKQISFDEGISRRDLKTIRERFLRLHKERLRRIRDELRPSQREFIDLLPLLFHINHPMLPGFVSTETPIGIPDYSPSRQALDVAKKLSRSFAYKKRAQRLYHIHGVYLMGSTGTIGQSSNSDFDLWLCHDPSLSDKQREKLQQKISLIEKSAAELELELHIFLIDPVRFRQGKKSKLSRESSGSTQHSLLLEEFYRSAVLLGGRYPLWWLVPPEHEEVYQEYADSLLFHRFVKARDVLDLGGLDNVPAHEFFGAALWQLYKGIDSPYKSILKIFLMEAYSRDYPSPRWLAQQAKEAVYGGEKEIDKLDAYILLYQRVEEYLKQTDDKDRLELARRCLYFKVGEHLSQSRQHDNWRIQAMLDLTRQWGWGQTQLQMMDTRSEWKIDRVIRERNALVSVLTRSYRLLTDFARKYAETSHIDPHELNLLGRKLYTALDHRPGKIDHINPGISRNLSEPQLSLHYRQARDGTLAWMLYRGKLDEEALIDQRPIKISNNLMEIVVWGHVNQVWGSDSVITLFPGETELTHNELLSLHHSIIQLFPHRMPASAGMQILAQPAYATMMAMFINIGVDPLEHLTKEGKQLTSERHDPLSFAAGRANLAIHHEVVIQTSWGELLINRHEQPEGLLDSLCNLLNLQPPVEQADTRLQAFSFSSVRGRQIAQRITELFEHIIQRFRSGELTHGRYAFRMGTEFFIVQQEKKKHYTWRSLESFESLLEELQQPQHVYRPLEFDPEIMAKSPYPLIFKHSQPQVIQLFFQIMAQKTEIHILDEQGALFSQTLAADSPRFLMMQQRRFLNSLQQLHNLLPGDTGNLLTEPEFFELSKRRNGEYHCEKRRVPLVRADDYMELTLVSDSAESNARPVSLICGDMEFTYLEYGNDLYSATAEYIHSLRHGDVRYPIYLTSLRLSSFQPTETPTTVELLELKRRVEERLNTIFPSDTAN
ncbi:MAG: class I adenylate cyclase [Candidatus Thiodiazotropha sp. (ex Monitilora ramsayi)]|nr:class I adenylate cyclase [Candidatus Thiodiazotropha sp. (ex Monitilora ramsayi)]